MKPKFTYLCVGFMALLLTGLKAKAQEPEPTTDTTSVQMTSLLAPLAPAKPHYAITNGDWNSITTWSLTPGGPAGTTIPTASDPVIIGSGFSVTINISAFAASINVNGTLNVNNTLTLDNNATITINSGGSIIFNSTGIITDVSQGSGTILTINSGANLITANPNGFNTGAKGVLLTGSFSIRPSNTLPAYSAGANYTYNGTTAQNTGSGLPATLTGNLTILNPAGVTLTNTNGITINSPGTLTVDGVLKTAASQTISGTGTLTGSGTVHASRISATPDFLTQYTISTKTLSNLTVDYNGTGAQTISTINYGHLTISANGNRTVTLPSAGTIGISGIFNPTTTNTTYITTGSTVNFNGSGVQSIPNFTYHHLSTSIGGIKTAGSSVSVLGNLSIGNTTTLSAGSALNVAGSFSNAGSFTHNNGTVTLNGAAAQAISGNTTFYNLTLSGSGSRDFGSTQITVDNAFTADGTSMAGTSTFIFTGNNGSIAGIAGKDFHKLQINNGANIAASGGVLSISNSFTNNGVFNQSAGINTSFKNNQTLTGSGTTTFGGLTIQGSFSLDAGTHSFTINGGALAALGTFSGGTATVSFAGNSSITGPGNIDFYHLSIASGNFSNPENKSFSVKGNWNNNGTYTAGTETITLSGTGQTIGGSNSTTFNHLTTAGTGIKTLTKDINTKGDLFIGNATTLSAGPALNVAGNFSNSGSFTHNNGTVTLNGTATQAISGNTTFYNLTLSGSGSRDFGSTQITVDNAFTANGTSMTGASTFILTGNNGSIAGTAAKEFYNLQINNGASIAVSGGSLTINNSFANNGTFNQTEGSTLFKNSQILAGGGTTTFSGLTVHDNSSLNAGTHSFTVNSGSLSALTGGSFKSGTATVTFTGTSNIGGAGTIDFHNLTIGSGAFSNPNNKNFTLTGNWTNNGTYTAGTETITFNGANQTIGGSNTTTFNNLNIAGTTTKTMSKDITIKGNLAIESNATLSAGPVLNVAGNFSNSGSFTHNNGTVTLNGTATQAISGNTTFYNLTLSGSGSRDFGSTQITVDNAFTANGTSMAGTSTFIFTGNNGSIAGIAGKDFHKLQINNGANIAASGGVLSISNSFTNNGVFNQSAGINTSFKNNQTLTGSGTTTFGGLTIQGSFSLDAGTHSFTINSGALAALGTFSGGTATVSFAGNSSITGPGNIDFYHLSIASGNFSNPENKSFSVKGNWTNNGTYTAGTETITLNGDNQTIGGNNTTTFNSLNIAGTADKTLANDINVATTLSLADKKINTGTNILTADNITRTSGYIVGNLRKSFSSANSGRLFEIGTSLYAPAVINFNNISSPGFLTATTTGAVHSSISSSNINPLQTVKRHWAITKDNALAFDNYALTLSYDESENEDTKHAPAYILGKFNPDTWDYPAVSPTPSTISLTATGLTSFSDFQIGRRKNAPPVLALIDAQSVEEETLLTFNTSAADQDPLNNLTFSLENAPEGASIDPQTGNFTWKPAKGKAGVYTFSVKVTNDGLPPMSAWQQVTVTVTPKPIICNVPKPSISVSRKDNTFTGLTENTIALGYGAQKLTLAATGDNLSWSPSAGLSNPNIANPEFTPTQPGIYTFTVTSNMESCQASNTVTINVVDVRCADKKVMVTHKEGKSNSVLCISINAVEAHLVQHGDRLGDYQTVDFIKRTYNTEPQETLSLKSLNPVIEHANTKFSAYPNPFSKQSTVRFTVPNDEQRVTLEVYNLSGRKVRHLYEGKAQAHQPYSFQLDGSNLAPGVYLIRLLTSKGMETFRVIMTE